jgi:uroporphyrinogen-III synthase
VNAEREPSDRVVGARVVVPVTVERRELAERLASAGAHVLAVECIRIVPARDEARLHSAAVAWRAGEYDWVVVTSRNAVAGLERAAAGLAIAGDAPATPVAVVGEATRGACEQAGWRIGLVPKREDAEGLVTAFPEGTGRVLAPLGNRAAPTLAKGLRAKGWTVDAVEAYRTVDGAGLTAAARAALIEGSADAVVLTSASVADRIRRDLRGDAIHPRTVIVAMGASTARAAEEQGLPPSIVASRPSYDGILEALATALEEPS